MVHTPSSHTHSQNPLYISGRSNKARLMHAELDFNTTIFECMNNLHEPVRNESKAAGAARVEKILDVQESHEPFLRYLLGEHAFNEHICGSSLFQIYTMRNIRDWCVEGAGRSKFSHLVLEFFRGGGKTIFSTLFIPIYLLLAKQMRGMLLINRTSEEACRGLQSIYSALTLNKQLAKDCEIERLEGTPTKGYFNAIRPNAKNPILFKACGLEQSPRGTHSALLRPNYIVLDDFDSREVATNPARRKKHQEWITGDVFPVPDLKYKRLFVYSQNFVHEDGYLQEAKKIEGAKVISVPLTVSYRPDKNPGGGKWPDRRHPFLLDDLKNGKKHYSSWVKKNSMQACTELILQMCSDPVSTATAKREMYHQPAEASGLFEEMPIYVSSPHPAQCEEVIAYCDPNWKPGKNADYTAVVVAGAYKGNIYIYVIRACNLMNAPQLCYEVAAQFATDYDMAIPPYNFYCEGGGFQEGHVFDQFQTYGGERSFMWSPRFTQQPKSKKETRISALSMPFAYRTQQAHIFIHEDARKSKKGKEGCRGLEAQMSGFGSLRNDDIIDAVSGIYLLILPKMHKLDGQLIQTSGKLERPRAF